MKLKAQASSSKTVPVGKKMTDFFAAKKQKNKQGAFDASSKISAHEQGTLNRELNNNIMPCKPKRLRETF